jgi:hypothetical protein
VRATLTVLSFGLIALAVFLAIHSHIRQAAIREISSSVRSSANSTKYDFDKDIKPIFQARCQPCHFQGGQMYDKLPFDKPATITKLGNKLFTRIKDEKERRVIQEFLDASSSTPQNR